MSVEQAIVVVSGLPRSGTSMMMRMLEAGGLEALTDRIRSADDDNPRGYYELEAVKRTDVDPSWLDGASGKVAKVISALLADLPTGPRYKVIFMRRDLDEILASQVKMLDRRGEDHGDSDQSMKEHFVAHLDEVETLLRTRDDMDALFVNYRRTVEDPGKTIDRLGVFLDGRLDLARMREVVEPELYRNRASG